MWPGQKPGPSPWASGEKQPLPKDGAGAGAGAGWGRVPSALLPALLGPLCPRPASQDIARLPDASAGKCLPPSSSLLPELPSWALQPGPMGMVKWPLGKEVAPGGGNYSLADDNFRKEKLTGGRMERWQPEV